MPLRPRFFSGGGGSTTGVFWTLPSGPYRHESTFVALTSPLRLSSVFSSHVYDRSICWFFAAACLAAASFCCRSCALVGAATPKASASTVNVHTQTVFFMVLLL